MTSKRRSFGQKLAVLDPLKSCQRMHKARVEEVGEDHGGTGAFMATSVICREYAGITALLARRRV
jgi:hypothetical protein